MYFCNNCNNVFDITKSSTQSGGDIYGNLINKILDNLTIDKKEIEGLSLNELINNSNYKKLKNKHKEYVYNKFQDLIFIRKKQENDGNNKYEKVYFICNNCGFKKPIDEDTLIFSKVSSNISQNYSTTDFKDMINCDILPRTRKYICPNSKCESYIDIKKREASFFRMNNTFQVKYICHACGTIF